MSAPKKVTIILTVHNGAEFLAEALSSLERQSCPDWQLIAWDDGSTDESAQILTAFARRIEADKVRLLLCPDHFGRSEGLHRASVGMKTVSPTPYLALLDADDRLDARAIEATLRWLEAHPAAGFVYTQMQPMNEEGEVCGHPQNLPCTAEGLLGRFQACHFRLMRAETFWKAGGFNKNYQTAMDYDLCLRMSEAAEFGHLPQVLYYKRTHPGQISVQRARQQAFDSTQAVLSAIRRRGQEAMRVAQ